MWKELGELSLKIDLSDKRETASTGKGDRDCIFQRPSGKMEGLSAGDRIPWRVDSS